MKGRHKMVKKKKTLITNVIILAAIAVFFTCNLAMAQTVTPCGTLAEFTLYAGQTINVGTISVYNDSENLYVKYNTTDGWLLNKTHLAIATSLENIPQTKKNNPIPGLFPYKSTHASVTEHVYVINLEEAGYTVDTELYIAAQADVSLMDDYGYIIQEETAWGNGITFSGENWATYFNYMVQPCGGVTFNEGIDILEVTEEITPNGGTLLVSDPSSPIYGVTIQFPGGALPQNTSVSVGYNTGSLTPNRGIYSGVNLIIETPGVEHFSQPVEIIVPFNDASGNAVPVPYFINEDGTLSPAQLISINRVDNTFTFHAFHASLWTWIIDIFTDSPDTDTGFRPLDDGFKIDNVGSSFSNGECLGMSTFSMWYYENKESSEGRFYPKFYDVLGQDHEGNSIRGQDVIATRAHISCHQYVIYYLGIFNQQMNLTAEERYNSITNAITNTLEPVLIILFEAAENVGHAVHAFGFDDEDDEGQLFIYDPNYSGDTREIIYDKTNKEFENYEDYDRVAMGGNGSLSLVESYENILSDAKIDFNSSTMPIINIDSHQSGDTVDTHNITLSGQISSVEVLIDKIEVIIHTDKFLASVDQSGNFLIPITLSSGVNHLKFATYGKNPTGDEIQVTPTNMDTEDFTIEVVVPASMILMTLTWDKDDTDLDTYVIDPTGDYSAYYHMVTADGGELDRDDVDGFGPEHWTLMNTDIVRYGQPYRFRVHYYSDHGNGGTNYTVTIKLYEGTSREVTHTYTGYLSVSNPSNSGPLDTGSDWADLAELTLTNGSAGTSSLLFTPLTSPATLTEPTLSVPVPSEEERLLMKQQP